VAVLEELSLMLLLLLLLLEEVLLNEESSFPDIELLDKRGLIGMGNLGNQLLEDEELLEVELLG